ncbi:MAG TPA: DUF5672 family protein [Burkholderiaceae bacterium]|nr:DUF5672 family protein [Burkholderiaceae bacterium]
MNPKPLRDVSLCCIDTRTPAVALYALRASMAQCAFAKVILFSDKTAENLDLTGIELIKIPPIKTIDQYSHFVLKDVAKHISTSHALIIQWDGFVINGHLWQDDFLTFDYIGAPWLHGPGNGLVGNGGFSLRSKRLLDIVAQKEFEASNPEDLCICIEHRARLEREHQIVFAPAAQAEYFACERGDWHSAFGFHGLFNFPNFMPEVQLADYIAALPQDLCGSKDARHLIRNCMIRHDFTNASTILDKRAKLQGWTRDHLLLKLRLFFGAFTISLKKHVSAKHQ